MLCNVVVHKNNKDRKWNQGEISFSRIIPEIPTVTFLLKKKAKNR